MLNCMKHVKIEDIAESDSGRSDSTHSVAPLALENLPWDPENRIPEEEAYIKKYVINKRDPNWYRPRPVLLKKNSVWMIQKYINDQQTQPQYTVGDMEDIMCSRRSEKRTVDRLSWLYDMFLYAWIPRLKVLKPFELDYDKLFSEIKPIANGLQDIAKLISSQKTTDNTCQDEPLKLVDVTSEDDNINDESDIKIKLPFKLLYQTHIDLLRLHGMYENCYIQLMKLGDEQDKEDVVLMKANIREPGDMRESKMAKGKKYLNYWERLQKSKMKQKLRQEKLVHTRSDKTAEINVSEEPSNGTNTAFNQLVNTDDENNKGNLTDNDATTDVSSEITESKQSKQRKKKKRGLVRRLTAPFRWIKKKF